MFSIPLCQTSPTDHKSTLFQNYEPLFVDALHDILNMVIDGEKWAVVGLLHLAIQPSSPIPMEFTISNGIHSLKWGAFQHGGQSLLDKEGKLCLAAAMPLPNTIKLIPRMLMDIMPTFVKYTH